MKELKEYDRKDLPPFKEGTAGYMLPKPGADVAVCVAPCDETITRPASWGPGAELKIKEGIHHVAQDGEGDSYPNEEYPDFYVETGEPKPDDPRAKFLKKFWAALGYDVVVKLAKKTKPALVLGEITPEAAGSTFVSTEGPVVLVEGTRILQSPDDPSFVWPVGPGVYTKKYFDGGKILPGRP